MNIDSNRGIRQVNGKARRARVGDVESGTTTRFATVLLTASLLLGTAGCSNESTTAATAEPAAQPTPSVSASTSTERPEPSGPTLNLNKSEDRAWCMSHDALLEGEGVEHFGRGPVKRAYCDMVAFYRFYGYSDLYKKDFEDYAAAEFDGPKRYMTPSLQKWWDRRVPKALSGDEDAIGDVFALIGFSIPEEKRKKGQRRTYFRFVDDGPLFLNKSESGAATWVNRDKGKPPTLGIRIYSYGVANLVDKGRSVYYRVKRDSTWTLDPTGDKKTPWLIDGYRGVTSSKKVKNAY